LFFLLKGVVVPIGKGRIVRQPGAMSPNGAASARGRSRDDRIAILSFGTRLHDSLIAANEIEQIDPSIGVTVADARFMKPLDLDLIHNLVKENSVIITIEEGSIGGFGDHVLHHLANEGALDDGKLKFRAMVLPDKLFEAGTQNEQYDEAGLNTKHIKDTILRVTKRVTSPAIEVYK
jgi:1-deoxy-D-xylulose-5-phosphate synthase